MNVATKMFCVMMIEIHKDISERHMSGFIGGLSWRVLMHGRVQVYLHMYDCMGL